MSAQYELSDEAQEVVEQLAAKCNVSVGEIMSEAIGLLEAALLLNKGEKLAIVDANGWSEITLNLKVKKPSSKKKI